MKVTVLNGSPKGSYSVSLHYGLYLDKIRDDWEIEVFHMAQKIHSLEKGAEKRSAIMASVKESDLVLWCYPVYTFIAPWQVMRFLEILSAEEKELFRGKYTSQVITSMHFYDHTARDYMTSVLSQMEMNVLPAFCAETEELKSAKGQRLLTSFAEQISGKIKRKAPVATIPATRPLPLCDFKPEAGTSPQKSKSLGEYLILADRTSEETNLNRMIKLFRESCPVPTRIIYRDEIPGKGGCLGCMSCTVQGHCVYKDGFEDFHRKKILKADGIIYALEVGEGWFNPGWKRMDDRCFYNGHRISQMGMPVGYILSGPLSSFPHIRHIIQARSEVGKLFLLDILSDEGIDSSELEAQIREMGHFAAETLEKRFLPSISFLGIGGMKVFRDLIFTMRGFMAEDHRFYKKHKLYDFPHKKKKAIMSGYLLGGMMRVPSIRKKALVHMKEGMVGEYRKVVGN